MHIQSQTRSRNLLVSVILLGLSAVTVWDASRMTIRASYGMGANAASYFIAIVLLLLAAGHIASSFKAADLDVDHADWSAVGWVALALASLICSVWIGAGFVLGAALLFAFTARAFGRKALLSDVCLGAVLGVAIFLFFNKLLTLTLPEGPIERLF
ncbi:tripartite tricarboxylate transporter TctB family protein [Rhizobium aegyptiacum]|uniref:tripartite tricarboxylate transporter TctB family protein n=1 Tax=Rhizobium aegyptiacum TaxID=1764550 RepID=UPI0007E5641D|nr:tripartite tricarboxylate transporter TctB family protein [Rhizobium aegyptiacum]